MREGSIQTLCNRSGEDGKFGHRDGDDSHDARRDPTESSAIAQPNTAKTPLQCEQLLHAALDTALLLGRADNVGLSKLHNGDQVCQRDYADTAGEDLTDKVVNCQGLQQRKNWIAVCNTSG